MPRSYPSTHDAERAAWAPTVAAGQVHCRRGTACRADSSLIEPTEEWDLGHPDAACAAPIAPEHRACNRATATWTRAAGHRAPEDHPALRALQRGV